MSSPLPYVLAISLASSLLACRGPASQAMSNPSGANPNPGTAAGGVPAAGPVAETPKGATLTATRDQTVAIVLAGLATAGYEWNLVEGSFDARVIRFKGKRIGDLPPNPMPGTSAQEIFEFVGVAPGTTTVKLANYRPWEGLKADSDSATFTVTVR